MLWDEIRELYPNSFVKLKVLESFIIENKEYVTDVEVEEVFTDAKKVMKELGKCDSRHIIYSTYHKDITLEIVRQVGFRRIITE